MESNEMDKLRYCEFDFQHESTLWTDKWHFVQHNTDKTSQERQWFQPTLCPQNEAETPDIRFAL